MTTLARLLDQQAASHPDRTALILISQDQPDQPLSYRQLADGARQTACWLADCGLRQGDRVIIALSDLARTIDAFWGCQYLGVIPAIVPYPGDLKDPAAHIDRLKSQVMLFNISAIITDEAIASRFGDSTHVLIPTSNTVTCDLPPLPGDEADIAYIQFSSGTTGAPRGVPIRQGMIRRFIEARNREYHITVEDVVVSWLPLYHDMGLVGSLLAPVYTGTLSVLIPAHQWVRTPRMLFDAIHRYRGTLLSMPNFAFAHSVRAMQDESGAALDLSCIRILMSGAELIRAEDQDLFASHFVRFGFNPSALTCGYGMAETVLGVTVTPLQSRPHVDYVDALILQQENRAQPTPPDAPTARAVVSCGLPYQDCDLRIIDQQNTPLPDRHLGQIIVRAPWMFDGYLGSAESGLIDGWLHTGDLGYLAEGELYIVGRLKDLIIVGGQNIHPAEIESIVGELPGLRAGRIVAFSIPVSALGTEAAVVVCETRSTDPAELKHLSTRIRRAVRERLGLTLGHIHFVEANWIVKTTSGKLSRSANREKYLVQHTEAPSQTSTDQIESRLTAIWEEVLATSPIHLYDSYFALGGTSLDALILVTRVEQAFGRRLPLNALLEASTIAEMSEVIRKNAEVAQQIIVPLLPHGTRPPLFLMHTLAGNLLRYSQLLNYMPPDLPVFGLQYRPFDWDSRKQITMAAMAQDYAAHIRAIQPEGPYYLGGYSFGGFIAFAVAEALLQQGQQIGLLALFDTAAKTSLTPASLSNRLLLEVQQDRLSYIRQGVERFAKKHLTDRVQRWKKIVIQRDVRAWIELANIRALQDYDIKPIAAPILYFVASETHHWGAVDFWRQQTTSDFQTFEASASHFTMLYEPSAPIVARHLDLVLRSPAPR